MSGMPIHQSQQQPEVSPSNNSFQTTSNLNSRNSNTNSATINKRKRCVANRAARTSSDGVFKDNGNVSNSNTDTNHANTNAPPSSMNENTSKSTGGNKWNRNGYGQAIEPTIGKFSSEESKTVKSAVEEYCATHGVTTARLCSESDNRTDHLRGAWMDIAKQLPHRTVQSVYRHGLRLMHPFKRGVWDEKETNELLLLVTTHGKKWSEIQNKLNRSADSCRDKYREFHTNFTKGKWKHRESKELEMHVRKALKVGDDVPLIELGKLVEQDSVNVPWSTISEKMKNRSRLSCFKRFQQITGMKKSTGKKRKKSEDNQGPNGNSADGSLDNEPNGTVSGTSSTNPGSSPSANVALPLSAQVAVSIPATAHNATSSNATSTISIAPLPISTSLTANPIQSSLPEASHLSIPDPTAIPAETANDASAYDRHLLDSLATSSFERETDVAWDSIQYPIGDAKERWCILLDKWIETFGLNEDEVYDKPVWEVAKDILNQELEVVDEDQAEMAARTVEAVFLC